MTDAALAPRRAGTLALAAGLAVVGILGAGVLRAKLRRGPRGTVSGRESIPMERRAADCSRETFKARKVPPDVDWIVVGSGIGSLYCAAVLAKLGHRVVVLEQHYIAGGATHAFVDHGFEFDTGVHYVGRADKYGKLLDLVSGERKVRWAQMGSKEDGFVYDRLAVGADPPLDLPAGEAAFRAAILARFPGEDAALDAYLAMCKRVNRDLGPALFSRLLPSWLQWVLDRTMNRQALRLAGRSTQEVLDEVVPNRELQMVLLAQFGDYGLTPDRSSFAIHAGVVMHYLEGGYYPEGGSQEISRCLIPTIEATGGRVLVRARVKEIVVDWRGRACGVRVAGVNGEAATVLAGKGVISGAGLPVTHQLVPERLRARLGWDAALREVKASTAHVTVFIGLRGSREDLQLPSYNLWQLPLDADGKLASPGLDPHADPADSADPWASVQGRDMLMFVAFSSAKDPRASERMPGKSTCEMLLPCPPHWFDAFLSSDARRNVSGKRKDADYDALKRSLRDKALARLFELHPHLQDRVEYCEVGTPLSQLYYYNRRDSYGLEHSAARYGSAFSCVRPQTGIPGLLITGQDLCTVGVAGAIAGALITAHRAAGYGVLDLLLLKRDLVTDLAAVAQTSASEGNLLRS